MEIINIICGRLWMLSQMKCIQHFESSPILEAMPHTLDLCEESLHTEMVGHLLFITLFIT